MSSAPVIDSLYAAVGSGNTVNISGHVSDFDPNAGAISVALGGPVSANVSVDSSGMFYYSGQASQLGTEQAVAADAGTGLSSAAIQAPIENAAPVIQNFSVSPTGDGKNVLLSGRVQDESPAGLVVNFSGVASGSATTDASGNFSLVTLASDLGKVAASTSDVWWAASQPASATLNDPGPAVQLDAPQCDTTGMVTISGTVSDLTPGGATVNISGVVSGTVTTDAYGRFSLTALSSGPGTVTVAATNLWNQTSAAAQTTVGSQTVGAGTTTTTTTSTTQTTVGSNPVNAIPYEIVDLYATWLGSGEWQISGTVQGGDLATTTVSYTGTADGSITVDSSGNFTFTVVTSGPYYQGSETCVASDDLGDVSPEAVISFGMA